MNWERILIVGLMLLLAGCTRDRSAPGLYRSYCARCHGRQGEGNPRARKLYPNLDLIASPMVRRGHRAAVRQRIAQGHGPMPGFSRRLTLQEIEILVDYTLELPSRKEKG